MLVLFLIVDQTSLRSMNCHMCDRIVGVVYNGHSFLRNTTWPYPDESQSIVVFSRIIVATIKSIMKFSERCFSNAGASAWNSLPHYVQEITNQQYNSKNNWNQFCFEERSLTRCRFARGLINLKSKKVIANLHGVKERSSKQNWFKLSFGVVLVFRFIKPSDLGFTAILLLFSFFPSATLRARWTKLNQNQSHARKWVRFENVCPKCGVVPPRTNRGSKRHFFDDFST